MRCHVPINSVAPFFCVLPTHSPQLALTILWKLQLLNTVAKFTWSTWLIKAKIIKRTYTKRIEAKPWIPLFLLTYIARRFLSKRVLIPTLDQAQNEYQAFSMCIGYRCILCKRQCKCSIPNHGHFRYTYTLTSSKLLGIWLKIPMRMQFKMSRKQRPSLQGCTKQRKCDYCTCCSIIITNT